MQGQLWVELVGQIIVVRTRGTTTVDAVHERHARIIRLFHDTGYKSVMFDFLEAEAPSFDVMAAQQRLNLELRALGLRVAVLVPNSRLAYLGRLVFGDENHRIVYDDMAQAVLWLHGEKDRQPIIATADRQSAR